MDKSKYDMIAHTELKYVSPLRTVMVEEVAELMRLAPATNIIDVGCAKAEILLHMADLCQVSAVGIDTSPQFLEIAKQEIAQRAPAADITLYATPVSEYKSELEIYDAAMCVNSSGLYGDYDKALAEITKLAKPGGMVIMGDYYWRTQANAGIQSFTVTHDYKGAVDSGIKQGLTALYATVCTPLDIDRYAWLQSYSIEMYAVENPDDPDVPAMLERSRQLRDEFIQYGRDALGFGLFLFRKPT
ncbi:MAG: class I SAM-dependent methyltransferase [Anaerolineae bacterium]|nr:class I SAM-dependent methyltransferase [Anaerolineae bacterium]MDQ7035125.1 class I SAM-dependent methyltransferase [Anaerolineae bacterium]